MINAINEIKAIRQQTMNVKNIVADLNKQAEEIDKKKHLIKAIALSSHIQELVNSGEFKKNNISSISIEREWKKSGFNLIYILKNEQGHKLGNNVSNSDYGQLIFKLNDLFSLFDNHNDRYINDTLIYRYVSDKFIPLSANIDSKILNLLLNKDLVKAVEYADLNIDLEDKSANNEITGKKVKL
jgi:hypothetical protein